MYFQKGKWTKAGTPWGCSSAGRAPALQAGGHRFDPVHLHHALARKSDETVYGLIAQVVRAHA